MFHSAQDMERLVGSWMEPLELGLSVCIDGAPLPQARLELREDCCPVPFQVNTFPGQRRFRTPVPPDERMESIIAK
jgi:hypothetical protein